MFGPQEASMVLGLYLVPWQIKSQTEHYRMTNKCMLTKPTSVEFHSHRDVATPCFGMNTHVTSLERTQEAVRDNEVPFKVAKEDLHKINVFI